MRIRSANPSNKPEIVANYLSTDGDVEMLLHGLQLARAIAATEPLRQHIEGEFEPGSSRADASGLIDFIRTRGGTIFHPCGTCRMGMDEDAVVDPELRVRGIDGLRVADASIMPTVVSGNIHAACVMIGEKASDLVRCVEEARK